MSFLSKFLAKKGVRVTKDGIAITRSSSESWLEVGPGEDPQFSPEMSQMFKGFPGGVPAELAGLLNTPPGTEVEPDARSAVDLSSFSLRALQAVDAVNQARLLQDPGRAKPFVTHEFFDRWRFPDESRPAASRKTAVTIVNSKRDPLGDEVVARVSSTADGKTTTELWTFKRAPEAAENSRVQISCAACGAPFSSPQAGPCTNCGATVVPPPRDWVVDQIQSA